MLSPQKEQTVNHLEYAVLQLARLATERKKILTPDIMSKYLEQELHANPDAVNYVVGTLEMEKCIELVQKTVLPVEIGCSRCEQGSFEKKVMNGYVITKRGMSKFEGLYGTIGHHSFGTKLFPTLDTGC